MVPVGHASHRTPSTERVPSGQVAQNALPALKATRPARHGAHAVRGHASGA
jgi:hypothetical protein